MCLSLVTGGLEGGASVSPTAASLPKNNREHCSGHGGGAAARARPAFRQRKEPLHGKPGAENGTPVSQSVSQ